MKTLILGGVKSGKTRYAESLARASGKPVVVIATAQALDDEMAERIRQHKANRPADWLVVEEPLALGKTIQARTEGAFILVDCLTVWLTNLLMLDDDQRLVTELDSLLSVLSSLPNSIALVSNETNMGVVPAGELSRRYCDRAGVLNQRVAGACDQLTLMVAGLPLHLKGEPQKGRDMKGGQA